ncbi:MAG TPA: dynamin family protein [Pseudonocardiaceae bacterium]|nr:dynamin family protein [Pseudonocardiaceae bacterium]
MSSQPYSTVDLARMLIRDARSDLQAGSQLSAEVDAELAACQRRLDEPLRVALAGTLKSGKSTLLNALVGEEIAPTDATECTRVVTWFCGSAGPRIELTHDGGRRTSLPVLRTDGRLRLDLGPVTADRVERLEVGWPSSLLDQYTLVDTPGTSSNSRDVSARTLAFLTPDDGTCEADAIVYLMRSLHSADVALLRKLHEHAATGRGPLGIVGVLSRADETDGGQTTSLDGARAASAQLRAAHELNGLHRDFLAVSGLLALRGQTLRQQEFSTLDQLAALPDDVREAVLVSPGRFVTTELATPAAGREQLLTAFGMVGIRIAISLIRGGARDAPALAAELVRHSGLNDLHRTLRARFGSRNRQLKAHSALRTLRGILLRHRSPNTARVVSAVERLLADTHQFTELRLLAGLVALPVPDRTRNALGQVLGGHGTSATTRLGLLPDTTATHTRAAAFHAIRFWRDQLSEPLLDQPTTQSYRAAIRSCEAIMAGAA